MSHPSCWTETWKAACITSEASGVLADVDLVLDVFDSQVRSRSRQCCEERRRLTAVACEQVGALALR